MYSENIPKKLKKRSLTYCKLIKGSKADYMQDTIYEVIANMYCFQNNIQNNKD